MRNSVHHSEAFRLLLRRGSTSMLGHVVFEGQPRRVGRDSGSFSPSALGRSDPFVLDYSDQHQEHDLAQGKKRVSNIIRAKARGVIFHHPYRIACNLLTFRGCSRRTGSGLREQPTAGAEPPTGGSTWRAPKYPVSLRQIAPSWCTGGSVLASIPGSILGRAEAVPSPARASGCPSNGDLLPEARASLAR